MLVKWSDKSVMQGRPEFKSPLCNIVSHLMFLSVFFVHNFFLLVLILALGLGLLLGLP